MKLKSHCPTTHSSVTSNRVVKAANTIPSCCRHKTPAAPITAAASSGAIHTAPCLRSQQLSGPSNIQPVSGRKCGLPLSWCSGKSRQRCKRAALVSAVTQALPPPATLSIAAAPKNEGVINHEDLLPGLRKIEVIKVHLWRNIQNIQGCARKQIQQSVRQRSPQQRGQRRRRR